MVRCIVCGFPVISDEKGTVLWVGDMQVGVCKSEHKKYFCAALRILVESLEVRFAIERGEASKEALDCHYQGLLKK